MKIVLNAGLIVLLSSGIAFAKMEVQLSGGWNGKTVPKGQQCKLDGGKGATPPMTVTGLPDGTVMVLVEYNDKSYKPLSKKGGHGIIGFGLRAIQQSCRRFLG